MIGVLKRDNVHDILNLLKDVSKKAEDGSKKSEDWPTIFNLNDAEAPSPSPCWPGTHPNEIQIINVGTTKVRVAVSNETNAQ